LRFGRAFRQTVDTVDNCYTVILKCGRAGATAESEGGADMARLSPLVKQATPVVVDRAEGNWILAVDGVRYLDFTSGIGVTSTGHCHPRVVKAAQEQVGKVIHAQATTVMHQPLLELTELLGEVLPTGLDSVFYANSGAEAVEASLRLARMATGRPNIVTFQGGFHGRTFGAASITTAGTKFRTGFSPLVGGVVVAPFPYAYRLGLSEEDAVAYALRELDYLCDRDRARRDRRLHHRARAGRRRLHSRAGRVPPRP
jgi:4-aminobutyrate aminotransferase